MHAASRGDCTILAHVSRFPPVLPGASLNTMCPLVMGLAVCAMQIFVGRHQRKENVIVSGAPIQLVVSIVVLSNTHKACLSCATSRYKAYSYQASRLSVLNNTHRVTVSTLRCTRHCTDLFNFPNVPRSTIRSVIVFPAKITPTLPFPDPAALYAHMHYHLTLFFS